MLVDDSQLLLKTHKGHEASARQLWSRHSARLLAYAQSIVGSAADDVVQNVFISVLNQPRSVIRQVQDPAAWLMVLTRRCSLTHLRASRREAGRRERHAMSRASAESSGTDDLLAAALGSLPRRLREVVVLRHVAGLTFDQAAVALNANRNTIASRYREAIKRLRELVGVEGDSEVAAGSAT